MKRRKVFEEPESQRNSHSAVPVYDDECELLVPEVFCNDIYAEIRLFFLKKCDMMIKEKEAIYACFKRTASGSGASIF